MIGQMRHRIVIESPVYTPDDQGGNVLTWAEYSVVWAAVKPMGSSEFALAERPENRTNFEITIRNLPGLDTTMRVIHGGQILHLKGDPIRFDQDRKTFMKFKTMTGVKS